MALLQEGSAIYHHPLDSSGDSETVKSKVWTGTGSFESAKLGSGIASVDADGTLSGVEADYDTTVGSAKLAFLSWLRTPSNSLFGYAVGGRVSTAYASTIDRVAFSNDSRTTLATNLATSRGDLVGSFASRTHAYVCGGLANGFVRLDTIERMTFADQTLSTIGSVLTGTRDSGCGGVASQTAGYLGGGSGNHGTVPLFTTIDKLTFSGEGVATITSGLSGTRRSGAAVEDDTAAGYFCGGGTAAADNAAVSTIDKLTFSGESVSAITSGLSGTRDRMVGAYDNAAAGYIAGGTGLNTDASMVSTIDKLTFATEASSVLVSTLDIVKSHGVAGFSSGTAGYSLGGLAVISTATHTISINKLVFSSEATSVLTSTLVTTRRTTSGGPGSGFDNVK